MLSLEQEAENPSASAFSSSTPSPAAVPSARSRMDRGAASPAPSSLVRLLPPPPQQPAVGAPPRAAGDQARAPSPASSLSLLLCFFARVAHLHGRTAAGTERSRARLATLLKLQRVPSPRRRIAGESMPGSPSSSDPAPSQELAARSGDLRPFSSLRPPASPTSRRWLLFSCLLCCSSLHQAEEDDVCCLAWTPPRRSHGPLLAQRPARTTTAAQPVHQSGQGPCCASSR